MRYTAPYLFYELKRKKKLEHLDNYIVLLIFENVVTPTNKIAIY